VLCSDAFVSLAELQAEALGSAGLIELFVLPHPLAGIDDRELEGRVAVATQLVLGWLDQLQNEGEWNPT
jgi:hypothetical protein